MKTILDEVISSNSVIEEPLVAADFKPDNDVRWCAGCGGYSVLTPVQKMMPDLGIPKEKIAFISGIGCSGRFPYYMDTYGFHGIHGRPIAIASGLKIARPDLSVWVVTGDGDCMSIGGNHFIHGARRNVDINVLMFNNEVYSLTKGQYSPTSHRGQVTKSSPFGSLEEPFNPASLALGSSATFVARGYDKDKKQIEHLLHRASQHKGFAFVEIYTNCLIFNDKAFDDFTRKDVRDERTVTLEHGKPLVFGKDKDKGIRMDGFTPVVVDINGEYSIDDLLVHDEKDSTLAFILADMTYHEHLPRPVGVFQSLQKTSYDHAVDEQIAHAMDGDKNNELSDLLKGHDFWEVK